ncbi:hypothetical protein LEMLEM_LOCUS13305, partial [Lemmus lemmus]
QSPLTFIEQRLCAACNIRKLCLPPRFPYPYLHPVPYSNCSAYPTAVCSTEISTILITGDPTHYCPPGCAQEALETRNS